MTYMSLRFLICIADPPPVCGDGAQRAIFGAPCNLNGVPSGGFRRVRAAKCAKSRLCRIPDIEIWGSNFKPRTADIGARSARRDVQRPVSIRPWRGAFDDRAIIDAGREQAERAAWLGGETRETKRVGDRGR